MTHFEELERRILLDSDPLAFEANYDRVSPAWFAWASPELFDDASAQAELISVQSPGDHWVVRLKPESLDGIRSVRDTAPLLNQGAVQFQVVRGLGLPGQLLVASTGANPQAAAALAANEHVSYFEPDSIVEAQGARFPSEMADVTGPEHVSLHNLGQTGGKVDADIDAPEAWEITTGSRDVVVAVIDTGVDYTHPDLYKNIWINQGEIPAAVDPQDVDGDKLITFVDLNDPRNAALVADANGNSYKDAEDLLKAWGNGVDDDQNGFVDDLVGLDFEAGRYRSDPFDDQGHGTYVAGIIAAEGDSANGDPGKDSVGVNWQSSIMALKFLDDNNTGLLHDAMEALNYVTMMHRDHGVAVRVVNCSWITRYDSSGLKDSIRVAGEQGILIVAGAGNGDAFGNASNNDLSPVYPAAYELDNVISVTATDHHDQLVPSYNFGQTSVDLAAPGWGVYSTRLRGGIGVQFGTSFSTALVSGVAALVLSDPAIPPDVDVTVDELRNAILESVDQLDEPDRGLIATGGRLNAFKALQADTIAPRADLLNGAFKIVVGGGTSHEVEVRYADNGLVNHSTLDDLDILVCPQAAGTDCLDDGVASRLATRLRGVNESSDAVTLAATYEITPPGGDWDHDDNGTYEILLRPGEVTDVAGNGARPRWAGEQSAAPPVSLGEFKVEIGLFNVDSLDDTEDVEPGDGVAEDTSGNTSLRSAIMEANVFPGPNTIVLQEGRFALARAGSDDAASTGDLDITDELTIIGAGAGLTAIDASGLDRVFDVHGSGTLRLHNLTVTGGAVSLERGAERGLGGGGIRNAGNLQITDSVIAENRVDNGFGGGILNFQPASTVAILRSEITNNEASVGAAGVYNSEGVVNITDSAVSNNVLTEPLASGGGVYNFGGGQIELVQTTVAGHTAKDGAGIYSTGDGQVILARSTVRGNRAKLGAGGGIRLEGGSLSVSESSLYENTAEKNGGAISAQNASVTISTSTVSGNEVEADAIDESPGTGGGVFLQQSQLAMSHTTFTDNRATLGGGVFVDEASTLETEHSILAGNHAATGTDGQIVGTVISGGYNLIGVDFVPAPGPGDRLAPLGPLLGPLQDNGGFTWTHELLAGSPAIDAGDATITSGTDQRHVGRPVDGDHDGVAVSDIGATERYYGDIHGVVFDDRKENGIRDEWAEGMLEPGIGGWPIYLDLNGNGSPDLNEPITKTRNDDPNTELDETGQYSFRLLEPRGYVVTADSQSGWEHTSAPAVTRELAVGAIVTDIDFGYQARSGHTSGQVFNDLNGNRIKDAGELGIPGWTVYLDSLRGDTSAEVQTDSDGNYRFPDLRAGTYTIRGRPEFAWETSPGNAGELFHATFSNGTGAPDTQGFDVTADDRTTTRWHVATDAQNPLNHAFYFGVEDQDVYPTYTGPVRRYASSAAGTLTSPVIDLTQVAGTVLLKFDQLLDIKKSDAVHVRVLSNGQATDIADNRDLENVESVSLDLSRFVGQQIQIQFVFQATATDSESLTVPVTAGPPTLYVEVRDFEDAAHSSYDLRLENFVVPADEFEPNESFDTATILSVGPNRNVYPEELKAGLTIHQPGDEDLYRFTPERSGRAVFQVEFEHDKGDLDLRVYDASHSLVASSLSTTDDEVAVDVNSGEESVLITEGEDYFIRVNGFGGATQSEYFLLVDFLPDSVQPDVFEENDDFANATAANDLTKCKGKGGVNLADCNETKGVLTIDDGGSDVDFYTFEVTDDRTLEIGISFVHKFSNLNLFLYDAQQNLIAASTSADDHESITANVPTGRYYVAVRGDAEAVYDLRIDRRETLLDARENNDDPASARTLGTISSLELKNLNLHGRDASGSGDVDTFSFTVAQTGNLQADLSCAPTCGDLDLIFFDAESLEEGVNKGVILGSTRHEGWYIDNVTVESVGGYQVYVPRGEPVGALDFGSQVVMHTAEGVGQSGGIEGRVFQDVNGNRRMDQDEQGWPGVTVMLSLDIGQESFKMMTTTQDDDPETVEIDERGMYSFQGLTPAADYQVVVIEPTDAEQTFPIDQSFSSEDVDLTSLLADLAVATADFDRNGTIDIAIADSGNDSVTVFLNDAESGLSATEPYSVDPDRCDGPSTRCSPNSIAAGDLDGMNGPDMVVVNFEVPGVSIFFNDGNGGFSRPVILPTSVCSNSVIVGDFDGNDTLDLAVTGRAGDASDPGQLKVFLNDGSGGYPESMSHIYATGPDPKSVVSGQFNDDNGDGSIDSLDDPDLAIANFGAPSAEPSEKWKGSLWLFMNDPDNPGHFDHADTNQFSTGAGSYYLTAGDFDGIYGDDVAVANSWDPSVSIHLNDGTGSLNRSQAIHIAEEPLSVAAVDVDRDGDVDLVTSNVISDDRHTVTILENTGGGSFSDTRSQTVPVAQIATQGYYATVADLDGDRLPDVVVARPFSNDVVVLTNAIQHTRVPNRIAVSDRVVTEEDLTYFGMQPRFVAPAGDFNQDGVVDLQDIDLLGTEIAANRNNVAFDLNADDLVNVVDLMRFLFQNIITSGNKLVGDADFDGEVQFSDFVVLAENFGRSNMKWSQGDFDVDGVVQFSDFTHLADNFGKSAAVTSAVPLVAAVEQAMFDLADTLASTASAERSVQAAVISAAPSGVDTMPQRKSDLVDMTRRSMAGPVATHTARPRHSHDARSAEVWDVVFAQDDDDLFDSLAHDSVDDEFDRPLYCDCHTFSERRPNRTY